MKILNIVIDIENIDKFPGTKEDIQELRDKQAVISQVFGRVIRIYKGLSIEIDNIDYVKETIKEKVFEIIQKSKSISDLNTRVDRYICKLFKDDIRPLPTHYRYMTRKKGFKLLKSANIDNIYIRMCNLNETKN